MSNRKKIPPAERPGGANDLFVALDGLRTPGGCGTCDAFEEVVAAAYGVPGVHAIRIHHDDWCPTYRAMKQQGVAS